MTRALKNISFFFILSFLAVTSCTKISDLSIDYAQNPKHSINNLLIDPSDLYGIWHNTSDLIDTLKISDRYISRWDKVFNQYLHEYHYTINSDSIIIDYCGIFKIGTPIYHRNIYINAGKDSILIKGFNSVYPGAKGDVYSRIIK